MVFSFGNLLRNLAHMTETDPTDFAANIARMALPNNNPGTDCEDDSNGDVLARLLSQVMGDRYVRQPDDTNFKSVLSPPAKPTTVAPLASTDTAMPTQKASTKQRKQFWPLFDQSKSEISESTMQTGTTKPKEMEVDLDDDSSFMSCRSQPQADNKFDYPLPYRFPNDTCSFTVNSPSFKTSWSMLTYGSTKRHGIDHLYQSCLGIFSCPIKGCNFSCNSAIPRKNRRKFQPPLKPVGTELTCRIHGLKLVHQECNAIVHLTRSPDGTTTVTHSGHHSHPRPHENASPQAREWLQTIVAAAPELQPHQIKKGNPSTNRPPARDVHSAFGNLDRLAYLRMQLLCKVGSKFSLHDLPKWEEITGDKFLVAADLRHRDTAIISIQFPEMRKITKMNGGTEPLEDGEVSTLYIVLLYDICYDFLHSPAKPQDTNSYAFQTDTIEKIVTDEKYTSMGVTGTTAYSPLLKKYVPVLLSITFARTSTNYERHWRLLLEGIGYTNLKEFMDKFPGNISDFSDAEKGGFELALKKIFSIKQDDVIDIEGSDEEGSAMDVVSGLSPMGLGIQNGANYCYIISAMQLLLTFKTEFVIPLHEFFVSHRDKLDITTLTYQFLAIAAGCLSAKAIDIPTTANLRKVMKKKFPVEYQSAGQHDCGLFLSHFLDALTIELKGVASEDETIPSNVFKFEQVDTFLCHGCNKSR